MKDILFKKIAYIKRQKEVFKITVLPEFRKQTFFDKTMSEEEFNNKLNILRDLNEKELFYSKRLDHLNKLESIENSISYLKESVNNRDICFLSFNTEKQSVRVLIVYYKKSFNSEIILEETYEDDFSLQEILNRPYTRFICFDRINLLKLLDNKCISYNKELISCVQRMSLFYYNDLSTIYKLDKIYEDLGLGKEETDNSVRKIKKIFDGLINS